jgi:aspartate aminotransferase
VAGSSHSRPTEAFAAARVRSLATSPTLAVMDLARSLKAAGVDVIELGGGDPDFPTPGHIRYAARAALDAGETHYVASRGIPSLRSAIARKLKSDNGIDVDPDQGVIVAPGCKHALFSAIQAVVEPGVDVVVPEPNWVSYGPMIELAGGRAIPAPLDPDSGFRLSYEMLDRAITSNTRVLILCSPTNPTGLVPDHAELSAVARVAMEHDLLVLSDEMYEKLVFDRHAHISTATLPGMAERTLTFNGFSKAWAMTGWRLGYVAGPPALIEGVARVHGHSGTCAASFVQQAGVAALEGPQEFMADMLAAWDHRRRLVADGLSAIPGVRCPRPEAGFFAFADIRETGMKSGPCAEALLREARVSLTPGVAFGAAGEGHLRLSIATATDALEEAVQRIAEFFASRT